MARLEQLATFKPRTDTTEHERNKITRTYMYHKDEVWVEYGSSDEDSLVCMSRDM